MVRKLDRWAGKLSFALAAHMVGRPKDDTSIDGASLGAEKGDRDEGHL